jgi:hypothetical protein
MLNWDAAYHITKQRQADALREAEMARLCHLAVDVRAHQLNQPNWWGWLRQTFVLLGQLIFSNMPLITFSGNEVNYPKTQHEAPGPR